MADPINTVLRRSDQQLPVEMDRFWASCEDKVLSQHFIKWITENYTDDKPLFIGGSNANDETTCLRTMGGNVQEIRMLKCDHEEADDRIIFYVNHAVTVENFRRIIVASADTDVFVCLMYHFSRWMRFELT